MAAIMDGMHERTDEERKAYIEGALAAFDVAQGQLRGIILRAAMGRDSIAEMAARLKEDLDEMEVKGNGGR